MDKIPYTITTGPEPDDGTWHDVHDFIRGFGWRRGEKAVYCRDVERLLPPGPSDTSTRCLDELYLQLEPILALEADKLRRRLDESGPLRYDRILVPRFFKDVDCREFLSGIREALTVQPLSVEAPPRAKE